MIKNGIIAILISELWHTYMCEFKWMTFISLAAVIFFFICDIEEKINKYKSRRFFQRRINKEIDKIKISPPPVKAS